MQIKCWVCACDPKLFDFWIILDTFNIKYYPIYKQLNYSSLDPRLGHIKALNQPLRNCQRRHDIAGVVPLVLAGVWGWGTSHPARAMGASLLQLHEHTVLCYVQLHWLGGRLYIHAQRFTYIYMCMFAPTHPHTRHPLTRACICFTHSTLATAVPALHVLQLHHSHPQCSWGSLCSGIRFQISPVKQLLPKAGWGSSPIAITEDPHGVTLLSQQYQYFRTTSHSAA